MLKIQSYWLLDKVKYFLSKFCGSGIQYQMMCVSGAVQVFNWCDPSQSMCDKKKKKLTHSQGFSAPSRARTALGPGLSMIFAYHSQHWVFLWALLPECNIHEEAFMMLKMLSWWTS